MSEPFVCELNCLTCGHRWDVILSSPYERASEHKCPVCGSGEVGKARDLPAFLPPSPEKFTLPKLQREDWVS